MPIVQLVTKLYIMRVTIICTPIKYGDKIENYNRKDILASQEGLNCMELVTIGRTYGMHKRCHKC
jgi:hypothetical protein